MTIFIGFLNNKPLMPLVGTGPVWMDVVKAKVAMTHDHVRFDAVCRFDSEYYVEEGYYLEIFVIKGINKETRDNEDLGHAYSIEKY